MRNNALWNCRNPHQGEMKKVLCVCSAGLLRSPTIAWVLSNKGYNTRAVGMHDYALAQIDEVFITWADKVVCVDEGHAEEIRRKYALILDEKDIDVLHIPDIYGFRNPELVKIVEEKLKEKGYFD